MENSKIMKRTFKLLKKTRHGLVALMFMGYLGNPLSAQIFKISNLACGGSGLELTACQNSLASIRTQFEKIQNQVNDSLPAVDGERYANGMANSAVLSTKGLASDYAANIKIFSLGFSGGAAFDPGDTTLAGGDPKKYSGVAATLSFMMGLNLGIIPGIPKIGPVDLSKGVLFFNIFSMDIPSVITDRVPNLSGNFTTFGLNLRYKVIPGMDYLMGLFGWGGIDITSGLNYTKMKVQFEKDFQEKVTQNNINSTGYNFVGNFTGTGRVGPNLSVFTIPVDISTSATVLWVFQLYTGLGVDLNLGSSDMAAGIDDGKIYGKVGNNAHITGDAKLKLGGESGPDALSLRLFAGLQYDFKVLNTFSQFNYSPTSGTYGITFGMRVYY